VEAKKEGRRLKEGEEEEEEEEEGEEKGRIYTSELIRKEKN